jgi:hypothetical protein
MDLNRLGEWAFENNVITIPSKSKVLWLKRARIMEPSLERGGVPLKSEIRRLAREFLDAHQKLVGVHWLTSTGEHVGKQSQWCGRRSLPRRLGRPLDVGQECPVLSRDAGRSRWFAGISRAGLGRSFWGASGTGDGLRSPISSSVWIQWVRCSLEKDRSFSIWDMT